MKYRKEECVIDGSPVIKEGNFVSGMGIVSICLTGKMMGGD